MKTTIGSGIEKVLWSIAIPGFGQFLNKQYFKGVVLIALELLINSEGKINTAITLSFLGQTERAIQESNYQWLMFYPCVYLYAIWDAFKDGSSKEESPLLFIPFAMAAYIGTLGVIYSKVLRIRGVMPGPVFLPLACMVIGLGMGFIIRYFILKANRHSNSTEQTS